MANPSIVTLTANTWQKVATNVTTGIIHCKNPDNPVLQTYRMTGESAPTTTTEGILWDGESPLEISASAGIDVYLYAAGGAVKVRVAV